MVCSGTLTKPGGHVEHEVRRTPSANVPSGQEVQLVALLALVYRPAGQSAHSDGIIQTGGGARVVSVRHSVCRLSRTLQRTALFTHQSSPSSGSKCLRDKQGKQPRPWLTTRCPRGKEGTARTTRSCGSAQLDTQHTLCRWGFGRALCCAVMRTYSPA